MTSRALEPFIIDTFERAMRDAQRYTEQINRAIQPHMPFITEAVARQKRTLESLQPTIEMWARFQRTLQEHQAAADRFAAFSELVYVVAEPQAPVHVSAVQTHSSAVSLPLDARWEDVELRLSDSHTLTVRYKERNLGKYDYGDLGFARLNTRDGKPDKQWGLLIQLSVIAANSGVVTPTTEALSRELHIKKTALQKIKESLGRRLSRAFGIAESPFYPYNPQHGYRLRCKLTPEALLRGSGELHASGRQYNDDLLNEDEY